jgi:hypothetical protein
MQGQDPNLLLSELGHNDACGGGTDHQSITLQLSPQRPCMTNLLTIMAAIKDFAGSARNKVIQLRIVQHVIRHSANKSRFTAPHKKEHQAAAVELFYFLPLQIILEDGDEEEDVANCGYDDDDIDEELEKVAMACEQEMIADSSR